MCLIVHNHTRPVQNIKAFSTDLGHRLDVNFSLSHFKKKAGPTGPASINLQGVTTKEPVIVPFKRLSQRVGSKIYEKYFFIVVQRKDVSEIGCQFHIRA